MDKKELTQEQVAMLDRLIKYGMNDEKRLKALSEIVEASMAWGWMKKTLLQIGAISGAIALAAGLYHLIKGVS